jgi:dephospho-CoA kinase
MRVVALTGSIAAGKSTVAEIFRRFGATLFDADAVVRELQSPGTPVFAAIVARFGPSAIRADGALDRGVLRRLIVADEHARHDLEAIVHPAVEVLRHAAIAAARARGDQVLIAEIPLLFEAGDPAAYDAVIVVDAPEEERKRRLMRQRALAPDEAEQLMATQMPAEEKRARATWIIDNVADRAHLEARARDVWQALLR